MTTIRARGVLFDMDGVLVDSGGSVDRSWKKWLELRGLDVAHVAKVAHGRRAIDTLRILGPHLDADEEAKVMEAFECADTEGLFALEGVLDFIQQLPPEKWTVVTSATPRLARVRLTAGGIPVPDKFVDGAMVQHGKPHPEPYIKGAELLGIAPADCLVVEDAPAGIQAAKDAGCRVLAVLTTHSAEELTGADWTVSRLSDVRVALTGDEIELAF